MLSFFFFFFFLCIDGTRSEFLSYTLSSFLGEAELSSLDDASWAHAKLLSHACAIASPGEVRHAVELQEEKKKKKKKKKREKKQREKKRVHINTELLCTSPFTGFPSYNVPFFFFFLLSPHLYFLVVPHR